MISDCHPNQTNQQKTAVNHKTRLPGIKPDKNIGNKHGRDGQNQRVAFIQIHTAKQSHGANGREIRRMRNHAQYGAEKYKKIWKHIIDLTPRWCLFAI